MAQLDQVLGGEAGGGDAIGPGVGQSLPSLHRGQEHVRQTLSADERDRLVGDLRGRQQQAEALMSA
jgi:hypothetical protein